MEREGTGGGAVGVGTTFGVRGGVDDAVRNGSDGPRRARAQEPLAGFGEHPRGRGKEAERCAGPGRTERRRGGRRRRRPAAENGADAGGSGSGGALKSPDQDGYCARVVFGSFGYRGCGCPYCSAGAKVAADAHIAQRGLKYGSYPIVLGIHQI